MKEEVNPYFLSFSEVILSMKQFMLDHRLSLVKSEFEEEWFSQDTQSYASLFVMPNCPLEVVREIDQKHLFGICKVDIFPRNKVTIEICSMSQTMRYRLFHVISMDDMLGVLSYLNPDLN